MFDPGVRGWSFPITISIWNIGETRFGDLRAFQNLIFKVWQGRLGIVISYYNLNMEWRQTRFGDLRAALPFLIFEVWHGRLGLAISYHHPTME